MPPIDDTLLLGAAALVAITALFIVLWLAIAGRQSLRHTRELLRQREEELARLRAEHSGLSAAQDERQLQLQACRQDIVALREELGRGAGQLTEALQENARLLTQQREREGRHQEQLQLLNEARDNLKREFENLANRIFEDKGKSFTSTSQASLEAMLRPFREQITGFQDRINQVHTESQRGNMAIEKEIQKVLEIGLAMNEQAGNLTAALKGDKKAAGNWGEAQLERTLELAGLQAGEHYEAQPAYRDEQGQRKLPDLVIKLPDNKSIIIDSKVSLVDYDRAIAAETDEMRGEALNAHAQAVRNHIDDLAGREYAKLSGIDSPDFVLMFMPIEPAYIEAMKHNRELFNYGYRKGVIMVSHTTLMPILRTVANLWMIEQGNREAREIADRAGDIYNQVCVVTERLQRLGNTLNTVRSHYNDAVTGLVGKQGLHGKVERFRQLSARASKALVEPESLHAEFESDRLAQLADVPGDEATLPPPAADAPTGEEAGAGAAETDREAP